MVVDEGVVRRNGVLLVRCDLAPVRWWSLADVLVVAPEPSAVAALAAAAVVLGRYVGCSLVVVPIQRGEPLTETVGTGIEGFAVAGQSGTVVVASLDQVVLPFGDLTHQLEHVGDVRR